MHWLHLKQLEILSVIWRFVLFFFFFLTKEWWNTSHGLPWKKNKGLPESLLQQIFSLAISNRIFEQKYLPLFLNDETESLDFSRAATDVNSLKPLIKCPKLSHISLHRCFALSEEELSEFFKAKRGKLTQIELSSCSNVTDKVIFQLKDVRILNLTRCNIITNDSIQSLVKNCPDLIELSVFGCNKLTSTSIFSISHFKHLRSLSLARMSHCVTDVSLAEILNNCEHLCELNIARCRTLTNATLDLLSKVATRFTLLDFTTLNSFKESSLCNFFSNCTSLQILYLSFCSGVTDEVLLTISRACKQMKKLYLSRQESVTDVGTTAIANSLNLLEVLNLSRNVKITDKTLHALAKSCPNLNTLYFSRVNYGDNNKNPK